MADGFASTPPGTTPVPDPTELTTQAVDRASEQWLRTLTDLREIITTRISAMDTATTVRFETIVDMFHSQREIILSRVEVVETIAQERFGAIETQFKERDTRSERESRDNKVAVDAAFAAQKEAAAKQDESNLKAIDKSERATAKTIETNAELFQSALAGQNAILSDLKDRVVQMEARMAGAVSQRADQRGVQAAGMGILVAVFVGISMLVSIGGLIVALRH